jgi:PAS domain S-box-containing protein
VQSELAYRQRAETELRQLNQALEQQVHERTVQLQQQLAEIEAIYQSAPIGLNVLDTELRFVRINQRLADINGLSVEAHIGRTVREVLPDLADIADQLLRPILQTGKPLLNVEIQGETPAQPGVQRVWLEHFLPLKNGDRIIGISTVCEEITHRKQAEAELHHAHQQLEERATQLALTNQSLQNVMEELEVSQEELQQQNEELIEAHESIEEQRERYQDLFNFAPDGYIVTNAMGLIREVNQAASSMLFSSDFDPIGIPFNIYVSEADQRTLRNQLYEASLSHPTSHIQEFELTLIPRGGKPFPAAIAITAIHGSQSHLTGFRWLIRDISDRKRIEATLQQQAKQEQTLRRITQEIRQSLDLNTVLETATAEVTQTLQTDRVAIYRFNADWSGSFIAESVGQGWVPLVGSHVRKVWEDTYLQETQGGRYRNHETFAVSNIYTIGHRDCHIQLLEQFQARAYAIAPIFVGDSLWGLLGIYQNREPREWQTWEVELLEQIADQLAIAIQQSQLYKQVQTELQERQRAEEKLRRSLQEKEVLLKEIHHRVKNNMQLVSSMLRLQTDNISDPHTLELFNESQQRVKTMALIHEHLYRLRDLAHINFAAYIQDLARDVLLSYRKLIASVKLTLDVESIDLDLDTAIPCGLIVNELMSNALKYAFPNVGDRTHSPIGSNHEIKIQFKRDEPTGYVLTVLDNGVGVPTGINPETTNTLGMQLVYGLTQQLQGQLELSRNHGSTFTIRFGKT